MTGCATVADLLEITDNPARMSIEKVRAALGIGYSRARVVRDLAIEAVQIKAMAARFGELEAEPGASE